MEIRFPPLLTVGSRVWTTFGYSDHGPLDGPKFDIAPNMGGTIAGTERSYHTIDNLLYTVHWDNGQVSKHYANGLSCIGRFSTLCEFENAVNVTGPIKLTVGPQGGFRHVRLMLDYDGQSQDVEIYDRRLWFDCLEPLAKKHGATINTTKLPPKIRGKPST